MARFINVPNFPRQMGRVKTKPVKRVTHELIQNYFEQFTDKFEENKNVVARYTEIPSKKLRNIVTGYVTRLVKSREKV